MTAAAPLAIGSVPSPQSYRVKTQTPSIPHVANCNDAKTFSRKGLGKAPGWPPLERGTCTCETKDLVKSLYNNCWYNQVPTVTDWDACTCQCVNLWEEGQPKPDPSDSALLDKLEKYIETVLPSANGNGKMYTRGDDNTQGEYWQAAQASIKEVENTVPDNQEFAQAVKTKLKDKNGKFWSVYNRISK
jgi:hypothetical protein